MVAATASAAAGRVGACGGESRPGSGRCGSLWGVLHLLTLAFEGLTTMRFELVDRVLERSDDRLVAIKNLSSAEEYLADHFPVSR